MAHSLSSPSFQIAHNFQCSPSTSNDQRHAYNGYKQHHSSHQHHHHHHHRDVAPHTSSSHSSATDGKTTFRLSALKGKSWQNFGDIVDHESSTSDDEVDDPLETTNSRRHGSTSKIVRLNKRDIPLYGHCPESEPFSLVFCNKCRMVLKPPCLRTHIEQRHPERSGNGGSNSSSSTTAIPKEEIIEISEPQKPPPVNVNIEKPLKRPLPRKSTPPKEVADVTENSLESFSASNSPMSSAPSPKSRHRKRKKIETPEETTLDIVDTETFHMADATVNARQQSQQMDEPETVAANTECSIIVDKMDFVIASTATLVPALPRDNSSPPPLAPITHSISRSPSDHQTTSQAPFLIMAASYGGTYVVKQVETESEPQIDLKDLKVLKSVVKDTPPDVATVSPSTWYPNQPRPLAMNPFNLRRINSTLGSPYMTATQRNLLELRRSLRKGEKCAAVNKAPPKTWNLIRLFKVTH